MKGNQKIDERAWELLNGQLDGELNVDEQQELETLLASSAELRVAQAELNDMNECLLQVPDKAPPAYLHNAITSTVRLPLEEHNKSSKNGVFARLTENWLAPAFALTAGVLLTVGLYEIDSGPTNAGDMANMSGSMIKAGTTAKSELLDRFVFDDADISGAAELRQSGRDFLINVQINTELPAMLSVGYVDNPLQFIGVSSVSSPVEGLMVSDQKVTVEGKGDQHYTLLLRSPMDQLAASSAPLKIGLSVNYAQAIESELMVVKK